MRSLKRIAAVALLGALVVILALQEEQAVAVKIKLTPMAHMPIVLVHLTPTPSPTNTPTPDPDSTPTPTGTPPPPHWGGVRITKIVYEGAGLLEPDEYVEIKNIDIFTKFLKDWTLRDEANHVYTLPSFSLQPGQVCRIYTNEWHPEYCNFNFQSRSAIWDNAGECATLRYPDGAQIDSYCYY